MMMIRSASTTAILFLAFLPGLCALTAITPPTPTAPAAVASTTTTMIPITELLSTCVHACLHGCAEIRAVQQDRHKSPLEVEFKNAADPKSALTQADGAAQEAIVQALRREWGTELRIVGEEDDEEEDSSSDTAPSVACSSNDEQQVLRRDLCVNILQTNDDDCEDSVVVPLSDVTVFVDPLDGTREFVEERLSNCQSLVGIAVNGKAVAGAIGIPFPGGDIAQEATVVYGQIGAGHGVHDSRSAMVSTEALAVRHVHSLEPSNTYTDIPRPFLATGDATISVMNEARDIIRGEFGGSPVLFGGAGNKILSTALGHVDCTVQHAYGGPWDTCAAEAVLRSMGGHITDLMGNEIVVHRSDAPSFANKLGFVATGKDSAVRHDDLIAALRQSDVVQSYIAKRTKQEEGVQ